MGNSREIQTNLLTSLYTPFGVAVYFAHRAYALLSFGRSSVPSGKPFQGAMGFIVDVTTSDTSRPESRKQCVGRMGFLIRAVCVHVQRSPDLRVP